MKLLPPDPIYYQLRPGWEYVTSVNTDINKTFRRIKETIAKQKIKPSKVRELKVK